ncbi:hypothetical protein FBU59_002726, partial [Linderina macrospora]
MHGTLQLPSWEASIQQQLTQREARVATVAKVIESYNRLALKVGSYAAKSRELEARNKDMHSEHERLMENIERGGGVRAMPLAQQRITDLERENDSLKTERTELYRTQGTNAQRLLDLSDKMRENEESMRRQALELDDSNEQLRRATAKTEDMRAALKEKDGTIQVLQDELSALQLEITQIEHRCERLRVENDELVDRWLRKMNAEADSVNAVNQELERIRKTAAMAPAAVHVPIDDDDDFFALPNISLRGAAVEPRSVVGKVDTRSNELHSIAVAG